VTISSTRLIRILTLGSDGILGLALFPFVIIRRDIPAGEYRDRILRHEMIHLRQQLELFILPFYIWYLVEYCAGRLRGKNHYRATIDISFEKEADDNMDDINYLRARKLFGFFKYVSKG